jgi:ATP-dependent Clp protease adaptor protein ClpS
VSDTTVVEEPIVVPKEKSKQRSTSRPKKQPPYVVIVHNDDKHTFPYVIDVLQRVCGHSKEKAYQLTHQVHFAGQAAVWSGALEVAELKRDQIRNFGPDFYAIETVRFPLGVTIEPLPSD